METGSVLPIRNRNDRHVHRAQLRLSRGAPHHRLAFAVEEALRLVSLPGEDQGRMYYFRRLHVGGLPPGGDRGAWQASFQETLGQKSRQAVHGADARAERADVVYFRSEQEALELLLHRRLADRPVQEWFWPMVTGNRAGSGAAPSVLAIVEHLRAQPALWSAVASVLFAQPGFDSVRLLRAIPGALAEAWITEMDAGPVDRPARLQPWLAAERPLREQPAVRRALGAFGLENPGVLWLSTLAVIFESPSDLAAGIAVERARLQLLQWAATTENSPAAAPQRSLDIPGDASVRKIAQASYTIPDRSDAARPTPSSLPSSQTHPVRLGAAAAQSADFNELNLAGQPAPSAIDGMPLASQISDTFREGSSAPSHTPAAEPHWPATLGGAKDLSEWLLSGVTTHAAGLFFLLNAIERLGMARAISQGMPAPQFVHRVLLRLALRSGVSEDDPIVVWLRGTMDELTMTELPQPLDRAFLPTNLPFAPRVTTVDNLVRLWSIAVRRCCWRTARLETNEIVRRDGIFWVNRTDLDISMSIEAADVRIRKAGLDLDPGWLQWFGRVVRFHYVFHGDLNV